MGNGKRQKMDNGDSSSDRTVVLLGKVGNGKSATANCLLGHHVFESMPSLGGVTSACKLHGERILNVIETPGLFDSTVESNTMATEIANCITLAKDGIHAVLLVLSLRNRFSEEEAFAFECLCQIFGAKIADYVIVVFTHAEDLRKNLTLDELLENNCTDQLKNTLEKCGNRTIVFDIWTEEEDKISRQREELLSFVETVLEENGLMNSFNKSRLSEIDEAAQGISTENEINVGGVVEMIELRLKASISSLEKSWVVEMAARFEAYLKSMLADMVKTEHDLNEVRELLSQATERQSQATHRSRELQEHINGKPDFVIL